VTCNLGSLLTDNSGFAPLTGKAADGVTIGGEAPATVPSLRPGAPASVPGSATPAPEGGGTATGGAAGGTGQETGGQQQQQPGLPVPSLPVPGLGGG